MDSGVLSGDADSIIPEFYISRTQKQISLLEWTKTIILALKYKHNRSVPKSVAPSGHFIRNTEHVQRRCKHCGTKTPYVCVTCNVYLHADCFEAYHLALKV